MTPLTDQFSQSISEVEVTKHPIRSFGEACAFARRLERDRARLIFCVRELIACAPSDVTHNARSLLKEIDE